MLAPRQMINSFPYETADKLLYQEHKSGNGPVPFFELPHSPAHSEVDTMSSPSAVLKEDERFARKLSRGTPGDQALFSSIKTPEQKELARKRSQYYDEIFAVKEPISSARERASRESMVTADVRTNVIVWKVSL